MFAGKESSVTEGSLYWLTFGAKVAEEYLQVIALVSLSIKKVMIIRNYKNIIKDG